MKSLVVTGSNTGVGKTIVTAAIVACAMAAGRAVAVVKPAQTGVAPGDPGDIEEVRRLTGCGDVHELVRYAEPLAPATAARRSGQAGPAIAELAEAICGLADRDLVVVEGAGGALVRFNTAGQTLLDLALEMRRRLPGSERDGPGAELGIVLTASSQLGTLHASAATAAAIRGCGLQVGHVVIADWPATAPGLAARCNLRDLPDYAGAELSGVLTEGAGHLDRLGFARLARSSLSPALGGNLDVPAFIQATDPGPPRGEALDAHRSRARRR